MAMSPLSNAKLDEYLSQYSDKELVEGNLEILSKITKRVENRPFKSIKKSVRAALFEIDRLSIEYALLLPPKGSCGAVSVDKVASGAVTVGPVTGTYYQEFPK